jgi:hypothetical protein
MRIKTNDIVFFGLLMLGGAAAFWMRQRGVKIEEWPLAVTVLGLITWTLHGHSYYGLLRRRDENGELELQKDLHKKIDAEMLRKDGWRIFGYAAAVAIPLFGWQLFENRYPWVGQPLESNVANLNYYISIDDRDWVERYLASGVDVNGRTKEKVLPLESAIDYRNLWAANLLLDKGADPNLPASSGWPLLIVALRDSNLEVQQIAPSLIQHGAKVNVHDGSGWTPLHWAEHHHDDSISQLLLEAGADPQAKDVAGRTPAQVAIHESYK